MKLTAFDYYLIVDLEATCCDRNGENPNLIPRHEMEIIEIGAVLLDAKNLASLAEFDTFIRPVRHPELTPFCTQLTTIRQTDVDTAPYFPEALAAFKAWLAPYPQLLFCSWGDYDKTQLAQDCAYHQQPFPLDTPHLNIKRQFTESQNLSKRYGMDAALRLAGLNLIGTHHRGIDDVRNMAQLMPYILGRQLLNKAASA
ncbi:MAG: exonuclease domain-containing protein [Thiothrix sp.]|nr:MAG: exonuclease domain-containing protein [Thiothrix sp.]